MGWYRKTTPSSYPNTAASNFTDTSKNWRQHKNLYRYTSGFETASLTAVPGRYTDSTRTWRRIKALYRYTSSGTWQKVFGKFAGQPYPQIAALIRYDSYTGTDVGEFAEMGPGATSIAQGAAGTTYLWGRDGQDWQNIESLSGRTRTFVFGSTPVPENAALVTNDEGNFEGDKLRNSEAVILQYDKKYLWYRDRITLTNGSTGTSYSQTVRIIKQQPVINSLGFKTNNVVSAGSLKYVSFSIANQWYRSIDQSVSMFKWYILDTQFETPTEAKLWNSTFVSSVILTEDTTTLTGEDYFTIPTTFGGVSTTGKWLHVKLICKNSSSDTDVDYTIAPYNDVTDYVVAQISGAVPIGTNDTVTVDRTTTSYTVSVPTTGRGTWSNTPTSYRYQWYLQEQTAGSAYTWSPITGATSSSYDASLYKPTGTSATSRIVPVVWASNSSGESNSGYALTNSGGVNISSTLGGITISNPVSSTSAMIKYKLPVISTFTVTGGTRKISYVTTYSSDDPSATASVSFTGAATGSFTPSSSASTLTYNLNTIGTYNFTLTVTNASTNALAGSATATQNTISITGPTVYDFNFGNIIYQSTNGYTGLDVERFNIIPNSTSGRVLGIFIKDLVQGFSSTANGNGYLLYWSNADEYVIQWTGQPLGTSTSNILKYQVRFYKDQAYADIKYITKQTNVGSPSLSPGMYYDGAALNQVYTGAINEGTTLRIYFDGSAPLAGIAFTEVPASSFLNAGAVTAGSATTANADDSYTTLVTAVDKFNTPGISISSIDATDTTLTVNFTTSGGYSYYAYNLRTTSHSGTSVSSSTNDTSSPLSFSGLTAGTTYYLTMTPYTGMGQAGTSVQDSKSTTVSPGALTDVVLKSFTSGSLRLYAKTGTNTSKIEYYTSRYNPSFFSVERVPASGVVSVNTSASTSYFVGVIDVSAKTNGSYSWNSTLTPYNGTTAGSAVSSTNSLGTGTDNPTVTYTTTAGNTRIDLSSITFGGAANYYTIDVKTTSQTGTSLTGYPKVQQTSDTHAITGLTNGTTYYIRLTPYYYYTVDTTTDSSSIRFAGSVVDASKAPVTPAGTFTDLVYKEMYTGGFAAVFFTVSSTTDVTNFDANATRFYPYTTQTTGIVNYTAPTSGRGFIAVNLSAFSDYQSTTYKWTGQFTPKKGTTAGTTQYLYNMTSKSSGTPADLPGVTLGTPTTGSGTISTTLTLDANASRYTLYLYKGTALVSGYPLYLQTTTSLSFSGLTNGSEYTINVTPYYVYYLDPSASSTDPKNTIQFPGNVKTVSATPSAPALSYKACTNYDITNSSSPAYNQCYNLRNCVTTGAAGATCTPGSYYCTSNDISSSSSPAYYQCYNLTDCVTTGAAGNAC
jgi:hypothetical protein